MGIADLVPGISGGTIAFIMGFYQPLLDSIKTLNWSALQHLLKGRWREFDRLVAWKFLLTLVSGVITAFICLANFFHFIFQHEVYRTYLYSLFLGLILASFTFCMRQIKHWNWGCLLSLAVGAYLAYALTDVTIASPTSGQIFHEDVQLLNVRLILCGAIAICALLLPGISGSYLLTIFGVYPTVIEAFVDFIKGIKQASFNSEAFAILFSLGIGIVIGALGFARLVSWLLRSYPGQTLSMLSGFMIGALRSVWPFWTYEYALNPLKLAKGPQLIPIQAYLPSWDAPEVLPAVLCALAGFFLVFALEAVAKSQVLPNSTQRRKNAKAQR